MGRPALAGWSGEDEVQGHDNMRPSLCMNFIIALDGINPPRN